MKTFKRGMFKGNKKVQKSLLPKTRKDVRKTRRKLKKLMKREHVSKIKSSKVRSLPGQFVKAPSPEVIPTQSSVKLKNKASPKVKKNSVRFVNIVQEERNQDIKDQQKLTKEIEAKRRDLLVQANEEEELLIKRLEKQLGMNKMKSKNKTKSFAGDGLDYLLEICDRTSLEQSAAAEKYLAEMEETSDFDEDIAIVTGQDTKNKNKKQNIKNKQSEGNNDSKDNDSDSHSDFNDIDESSIEENTSDSNIDQEFNDDFENDDESAIESDLSDDTDIESDNSLDDDEDNLADIYSNNNGSSKKRKGGAFQETHKSKKKIKTTEKDSDHTDLKAKSKINTKIEQKKVNNVNNCERFEESFECVDSDSEGDEKVYGKGDENGVWEDIYGRKRDKEGNILKDETSRYIPPHLRKPVENDSEEIIQLKRQMKSIMNKLAGSNLHWACSQLENLYNSNSRNAVNSALCDLWLNAIVRNTLSAVRMVAEHAVLIAVLQANVGMEVGAHFLQVLVKLFNSKLIESNSLEDKSLDNLVSGLSYLYCFKIFHASLLFEILTRLMEDIKEKNIECILIALRNVGGVLRKDEPLLLKTFIHDTQAKTSQLTEQAAVGTRVKFLVDVLLAIKNNNLSKIPNYDPSYSEELKKSIRGIIRKGNYVTPLNIKLDDLLKADKRGKWWVVGSAWSGSTIERIDKGISENGAKSSPVSMNMMSKKLQDLARQQRMNTDARKNIFCIIMSAEDYMDAFEKLLHLGLKNQQERDIVHVLIACCLQEKKYNPYYSILAEKFCEYDRKFQLSIQYAVWDKLKEINNFTPLQLVNLAQLLTHMFIQKSLPISVLKVVHFSELNKPTLRLMRQILLAVLLHSCQDTCLEVFQRVAVSVKLHMFRESLRLFIRHFLLKNLMNEDNALDPEKKDLLEERASLVDRVLSAAESKLRF